MNSQSQAFPPGYGWVALTVAVVAALIMSAVAVVPNFGERVVAVNGPSGSANGGTSTTQGGPASGTTNGTTGTSGTSGTSGGAATSGGLAGGAATSGGLAGGSGPGSPQGFQCAPGRNGGATDAGISATEIHVASTIVTSGPGAGFLGEAADGMQAAINQVNNAGGICGRRVTITTINDGWNGPTGAGYINNFIQSKQVFALVGEPDSEGLDAAKKNGSIDNAGIPVVGTDGMLKSQYQDSWIWPVAASTVTNMHIIAKHAHDNGAKKFGIVYDSLYKFGLEGAAAFKAEVGRVGGQAPGTGCAQGFCGISPDQTDYSTSIQQFNSYCAACDAVVLLLEPQPAETWMRAEANVATSSWAKTLYGGEPLFDDQVGAACGDPCNHMIVWTGYKPAIQPFDDGAVATYCQALRSVRPQDDCHNEFTEGAYIGTQLFIKAALLAGPNLTRANLKQALDTMTFQSGMASDMHWGSNHLANLTMAAFGDNFSGSFNGWNYLQSGFLPDPAPGSDMQ
ncbi:MAG: ABC transporter substrate-binding protein [Candidatus Dormibacteria bacterium]